MKFSGQVAEAVEFARALHAGQVRKGTSEPYFGHLAATMEIATRYGANEVEKMGAVLHDAIEDHPRGGATEREIGERFGAEVLAVVKGCTNVYGSKMEYAEHLKTVPKSVALVAASDKLHNATTIVEAHNRGEAVFERFKYPKAVTVAYYKAVAEALKANAPAGLAAELEEMVKKMEAL